MSISRRSAEIALIAIAAVWGLTFVMVQDAIGRLPAMAFLAYRFIPAGLLVGVVFRRSLGRLPRTGWRAGLLMGAFLTAGYIAQTLGLEHTTASNAGFITGLFVVLTPLFGALIFGIRPGRAAWLAAGSRRPDCSCSRERAGLPVSGDGLELVCACAFASTSSSPRGRYERFEVGPLVAIQLTACGFFCLAVAAIGGDLAVPRGATVWSALMVTSLVASALAFLSRAMRNAARPGADGADPGGRAGVRRPVRLAAQDDGCPRPLGRARS